MCECAGGASRPSTADFPKSNLWASPELAGFIPPATASETAAHALRASRSKTAPNLLQRLSNAVAPDPAVPRETNDGNTLQHQESAVVETLKAPALLNTLKLSKLESMQFSHPSSIPAKGGRTTPPLKPMDCSYSEEELQTWELSESSCQPAAADSPLAVSSCHMLQFLAQLGPQHARSDSTLLKPSSVTDNGAAAPLEVPSTAVAPHSSRNFASIVAQANERQKAEDRGRAAEPRTPAVSILHQKGRSRFGR